MRTTLVLIVCLYLPAVAAAQPAAFAVDVGRDRAETENNGVNVVWITDRLQASWVDQAAGGWFVGAERHERGGDVNVTAFARGYKRAGRWTVAGGVGGTPDATYLYRVSADAELSRQIVGGLVASAGYRYMKFATVDVQQTQPALTYYHARGELQARGFFTRRSASGGSSRALLVQTLFDAHPRFRIRAGASRGARIFDVSLLAASENAAKTNVGFGSVRVGLTAHDFIEIGGTVAHEDPAFDYRALMLKYRRVF